MVERALSQLAQWGCDGPGGVLASAGATAVESYHTTVTTQSKLHTNLQVIQSIMQCTWYR